MEAWVENWNTCREILAYQIDTQLYSTFIKPLWAGIKGGNPVLFAPNTYILERVKKDYQKFIQQALKTLHIKQEVRLSLGGEGVSNGRASTPKKKKLSLEDLDDRLTFENFVVGPSNQEANDFCARMVEDVAQEASCQSPKRGGSCNLVVLYGEPGLGKTHLLSAMRYELGRQGVEGVCFEDTNQFKKNIIDGIGQRNIENVLSRYNGLKVLMLDDVQFLSNAPKVQQELLHTFNLITRKGGYVAMSCDQPLNKISKLNEQLKSRLTNGMMVRINPLEIDTATQILIQAAEQQDRFIGRKAAYEVAQRMRVQCTGRDLIGVITRLCYPIGMRGQEISFAEFCEAENDRIFKKQASIEQIQQAVLDHYNLTASALLSKRRNRAIARPRQIAMMLVRKLTNFSYPDIGAAFGNRNHTTVLHACRNIAALQQSDSSIQADITKIMCQIDNDTRKNP